MYTVVTYKNVYPNVDVRYYTGDNNLKYDIIVNPGADISQIAMQYDGVDGLEIKKNKLHIKTSVDEVQESLPSCFQYNNQSNARQTVKVQYKIKGKVVYFKVDDYDKNATLVIDPVVFCTFSGSSSDNWGYTATYGPDGSFYAGGIVFGFGFQTTPGAFSSVFSDGAEEGGDLTRNPPIAPLSGYDMGIMSFSPDGSSVRFGTYVGGRNGNEQPHSLVVDSQGNLFIAGRTSSNDYPTTTNGFGRTFGQTGRYDIVLTKLSPTGALLASKIIGGTANDGVNIRPKYVPPYGTESLRRNYGEDARSEVILDNAGNVCLASCTQSANFRTTINAFQNTLLGRQDGVVMRLTSDLSNVLLSSYLGGDGDDAAYVLAVNPSNNDLYVAGGTTSSNLFPGNKVGTIGPSYKGNIDGYISIISNATGMVTQSTYIGTNGADQVYGIQFDSRGFPYIMGTTTSQNWPIATTTGNPLYSDPGGKQFIAKLTPNLNSYVYSTVFGPNRGEGASPSISPSAFLVDRCENVYISGWGGSISEDGRATYPNAGTRGLPTANADNPNTDGNDFYFIVFKRDAQRVLYGSFFGQVGGVGEHVDGGTSRFDREGVIYQAICANCGNPNRKPPFPTTRGVAFPNNGSSDCNLAALKIAFDLAGIQGKIKTKIAGDTIICKGSTVTFEDVIRKAQTYMWDFKDGTMPVTTNVPTVSHQFNTNGRFKVMLIAVDPTSCNLRDTSYVNIRVGDKNAMLSFNTVRQIPCETYTVQFRNTSTPFPGTMFSDTAFGWDFGDNSPFLINGRLNTVFNHQYSGPGNYKVKFVLRDTLFCNVFDTIEQMVNITPIVKANFTVPTEGCVPYTAVFTNNSLNGQNYIWTFGDGGTSNQTNPTYVYNAVGRYPVKLIAIKPESCNIRDSVTTIITVNPIPVSNFTFSPPLVNTPTTFTNNSTSGIGVSYTWLFGDGESYTTTDRNTPVMHQYNATGSFNACLITTNQFGCKDTICQIVQAIVRPESDIPNAFTPGRFGENSSIKVKGFGIGQMTFRIFNRWGQKVFETNDRRVGWDGTVNGKLQPMDVYVYTLEIKYTDGTTKTQKGDITLIR